MVTLVEANNELKYVLSFSLNDINWIQFYIPRCILKYIPTKILYIEPTLLRSKKLSPYAL
jgi:hypothetical protein